MSTSALFIKKKRNIVNILNINTMDVFSSVIADIASDVIALFPVNIDDSTHLSSFDGSPKVTRCMDHTRLGGANSHDCCDVTTRIKAEFLATKLKEINADVSVLCVAENQSTLVKVSGAWGEVLSVHYWLTDWIQSIACSPSDELSLSVSTELMNEETEETFDTEIMATSEFRQSSRTTNLRARPRRNKTKKTNRLKHRRNTKRLNNDDFLVCGEDNEDNASSPNAECTKGDVMHQQNYVHDDYTDCDSEKKDTDLNTLSSVPHYSYTSETNEVIGNDILPITETRQKSYQLQIKMEACELEFRCSTCDFITNTQRNLTMHSARVHGRRTHACGVCSRTFAVLKDLNQHVKVHNENYCCELCGRTLRSKYALLLHISRIHHGAAPRPLKHYLCTLCGKMCRNKTTYTSHRNKEHTGVRPFQCSVCNTEFFARANLRAHEQIHKEERMYCCELCSKSFKQRQGLRVHMAVHAANRPYKCHTCTKAFTQRGALVRHLRTHTSSRPYSCRLCSSAFNDYSILRRHMLGIHKINDTCALRDSIRVACAEARQLEHSGETESFGSIDNAFLNSNTGTSETNSKRTISSNILKLQGNKAVRDLPTEQTLPDTAQSDEMYFSMLTGLVGKPDDGVPVASGTQLVPVAFVEQNVPRSTVSIISNAQTSQNCVSVDSLTRSINTQYVYLPVDNFEQSKTNYV